MVTPSKSPKKHKKPLSAHHGTGQSHVLWGLSGFFSFFGDFGKGQRTTDRCVLSHDGLGMKGPEYQEPLISGSIIRATDSGLTATSVIVGSPDKGVFKQGIITVVKVIRSMSGR